MDENLTRGYCLLKSDHGVGGPRKPLYFGNEDGQGGGTKPLPTSTTEASNTCSGSESSHRSEYEIDTNLDGVPEDTCSGIYIALLLCGAGFLIPYNSFIAAVDYYQEKYPGTTIVFDISLTYICVAFVGVVVNNVLVESFSLYTRIMFGYAVSFFTLLLITVFDIGLDVFSHDLSYSITLLAASITALGCTVQQSSFYGYTSMLPRRYTQAVMTGESAAGLIASINRILTKAVLKDHRVNTIIFFAIALCLVAFCFIAFSILRRTEFTRFYVRMCKDAGLQEDERAITSSSAHGHQSEEVGLVDILEPGTSRETYGILAIQSPVSSPMDSVDSATAGYCHLDGAVSYHNGNHQGSLESIHAPAVLPVRQQHHNGVLLRQRAKRSQYHRPHLSTWDSIKGGCYNRYKVACYAWPFMMSISLTYFVTLCLFPGIESEVYSCALGSWMPVLLIAVFNLFDFIGKIITSMDVDWSGGRLVLFTCLRFILIPLMMLCALPRVSPMLSSEGWAVCFSAVLGISNGYFGSVPMTLAPSAVPDGMKELTGNIMMLSYSVGLTGGSAVAYLLDDMLGPIPAHDPCDVTNATANHLNHTMTSFLEVLVNLKHSTD